MAYVANERFRQVFTNTERIVVNHQQDLEYPAVRVLVDDEARPDLILAILVDEEDPTNRLLVRLRSAQTGVVQLLDYDFQPAGVQSASILSLLDQGIRLNFGEDYNYSENLPIQSTTGTAFVTADTLNVNLSNLGRYRIGVSFTWAYSSTARNFNARVFVDGVDVVWTLVQEPKDTNLAQKNYAQALINRTFLVGAHTIEVQYASEQSGDTSQIDQVRIEFWRV